MTFNTTKDFTIFQKVFDLCARRLHRNEPLTVQFLIETLGSHCTTTVAYW